MTHFHAWLTTLLTDRSTRLGRYFAYFIIGLIAISSVAIMLETTPWGRTHHEYFLIFDLFIMAVFTVELLARLWVSRDFRTFITSPYTWIDIMVLLAYYLTFFNLAYLRFLRALRILKILKAFRYSPLIHSFFRSFRQYHDELRIFGASLFLVVVLGAFGLYYAEVGLNPDFKTLPDALWWTIVTVTTVGYGDIVPVTGPGRVIASVVMIMGVGTMAILTAMITRVFIDHFFGKQLLTCEFCHYPHHDYDAKFCKNCGGELSRREEFPVPTTR